MIEINTIESVLKKQLDKFMCFSYKIFKNPGRVFPGRAGPVFRLDPFQSNVMTGAGNPLCPGPSYGS